MTAIKGQSSRFTAVQGLITEQNDTNFVPDSMVAAENVIPKVSGDLARRGGLDISGTATSIDASVVSTGAVSKFKWKHPSNSYPSDVLVVQIGTKLYLYAYSGVLSETKLGEIDLSAYATDSRLVNEQCAYTTIVEHMIVVNRYMQPITVYIQSDGTVIVDYTLDLKIRVMDRLCGGKYVAYGVPEDPPMYRPVTISNEQLFDIRNSGWPAYTACTKDEAGSGVIETNPIEFSKDTLGFYPAPADMFQYYKTASATAAAALDTFSPWEMRKSQYSSSYAPVGHYITSAFRFAPLEQMQDEDDVLGLDGYYWYQETGNTNSVTTQLPIPINAAMFESPQWIGTIINPGDSYNGSVAAKRSIYGDSNLVVETTERPYAVATLNGHVIYMSKDYMGREVMLFSKMVFTITDAEVCYQDADPTAEEINDLLPTDGGMVAGHAIQDIVKIEEGLGGVLVFTKKGIWVINGGNELFSATNVNVQKVSTVECLGGQGVVRYDDKWYFWSQNGLYAMARNEYGDLKVQNITRTTINKFVSCFSKESLTNAIGDVDELSGRIYYTMPTVMTGVLGSNRYKSNILLVVDNELGGFYYHRISTDTDYPSMVSPIVVGGSQKVPYLAVITDEDGYGIVDEDVNSVYVDDFYNSQMPQELSILCFTDDKFLFAKFGTVFYEWSDYATQNSLEQLDYTSFAEFMHKRDNNLASNTHLTTVQSFFRVKELGIAIEGGAEIPVDPPMGDLCELNAPDYYWNMQGDLNGNKICWEVTFSALVVK